MIRYMRIRLNDGAYQVGYVEPATEEFTSEFSCFNEANAKAACDVCNFSQFENDVAIGAFMTMH